MASIPQPAPHREEHFQSSETVRDIVIGMADGLTVPFALAAGLSGAVAATRIIVTAGLAEIAAGSIAMGLGGYLAARSEVEHYASERRREETEIVELPEREKQEVRDVFTDYGLTVEQAEPVVEALSKNPKAWVDFMMRFELGLEEPRADRAWKSAITIALSYIAGGFIPLAPYMLVGDAATALKISIGVTILALAIFGAIKGRFTGVAMGTAALQTALVGGAAAAAAFAIARCL
jgi:VIT1/CCC1 family predicted Fe2+/Mn2+ transporter